jgi:YggT family protein
VILLIPVINVLLVILNLYWWVLILSAVLSWLVAFNVINTSNPFVSNITDMLWRLTEPVLRPIRRFMPNLGGIDISPVIVLLLIMLVSNYLEIAKYSLR